MDCRTVAVAVSSKSRLGFKQHDPIMNKNNQYQQKLIIILKQKTNYFSTMF